MFVPLVIRYARAWLTNFTFGLLSAIAKRALRRSETFRQAAILLLKILLATPRDTRHATAEGGPAHSSLFLALDSSLDDLRPDLREL